jgi:hypothetical protein
VKLCKNKLHDVEVTGVRVIRRPKGKFEFCKLCRVAMDKRWRVAHPEKVREYTIRTTARHRAVGGRWNYFWIKESRRGK